MKTMNLTSFGSILYLVVGIDVDPCPRMSVGKDSPLRIHIRKIGGFVRLFRMTIDSGSNPEDDAPIVKSKESTIMEERKDRDEISPARKDALVHDLVLVVKSAMAKVNSREQLWCDIIAKAESDIKRMVSETVR